MPAAASALNSAEAILISNTERGRERGKKTKLAIKQPIEILPMCLETLAQQVELLF